MIIVLLVVAVAIGVSGAMCWRLIMVALVVAASCGGGDGGDQLWWRWWWCLVLALVLVSR